MLDEIKELNEKVIRIEERLNNDETNIKNLQSLTNEIHKMACAIVKLTEQINFLKENNNKLHRNLLASEKENKNLKKKIQEFDIDISLTI